MPRGKAISRPVIRVRVPVDESIDRLIEAQHQLVTALSELVAKLANPPQITMPSASAPPDPRPGPLSYTRGTIAPASQETILDGFNDTAPGLIFVPRGTLPNDAAILGNSPDDEGALADDLDAAEQISPLHAALLDELEDYQAEDEIPPPPIDERALWGKRINAWRGQRLWMEGWGPRPGQEGCQVPQHMLNGRA